MIQKSHSVRLHWLMICYTILTYDHLSILRLSPYVFCLWTNLVDVEINLKKWIYIKKCKQKYSCHGTCMIFEFLINHWLDLDSGVVTDGRTVIPTWQIRGLFPVRRSKDTSRGEDEWVFSCDEEGRKEM